MTYTLTLKYYFIASLVYKDIKLMNLHTVNIFIPNLIGSATLMLRIFGKLVKGDDFKNQKKRVLLGALDFSY